MCAVGDDQSLCIFVKEYVASPPECLGLGGYVVCYTHFKCHLQQCWIKQRDTAQIFSPITDGQKATIHIVLPGLHWTLGFAHARGVHNYYRWLSYRKCLTGDVTIKLLANTCEGQIFFFMSCLSCLWAIAASTATDELLARWVYRYLPSIKFRSVSWCRKWWMVHSTYD